MIRKQISQKNQTKNQKANGGSKYIQDIVVDRILSNITLSSKPSRDISSPTRTTAETLATAAGQALAASSLPAQAARRSSTRRNSALTDLIDLDPHLQWPYLLPLPSI